MNRIVGHKWGHLRGNIWSEVNIALLENKIHRQIEEQAWRKIQIQVSDQVFYGIWNTIGRQLNG